MNGILLIDKPSGWTSFDVVHKVRRLAEQSGFNDTGKKRYPVGHTGTLDPLATGLLVLMLGAYTKKVPEYTKLDKTYDVTMCLGRTSTTGDAEGETTMISDHQPTQDEVLAALAKFEGELMQTPPAFSAIKVQGQRAYKLARNGQTPELKPRPVTIQKSVLTDYSYPFARFTVSVSSGTYIRSLVEDLGKELQVGAYMSDLRRTRVGEFHLSDALAMPALSTESLQAAVFTV